MAGRPPGGEGDTVSDHHRVEYIDRFAFGSLEKHMHVCYDPYGDNGGSTDTLLKMIIRSRDLPTT